MSKKPFWESNYSRNKSADTFSNGKPSSEIPALIRGLKTNSKILDLGCGDGRNSLYLASQGFHTKAIDISDAGIKKLREIASKNDLNITAEIQDIRTFIFKEKYDLILSQYCFYLIEKQYWMRLIKDMKNNTKVGGYNVISVFTDKLPIPDDLKDFAVGIFNEGELFSYYTDWKIILQKSFIDEDEHDGGIKHKHAINKIVAKKNAALI